MAIPTSLSFGKEKIAEATGGADYAPIPAGNYAATIFKVEVKEFGAPKPGKGDNSGKPYYNIQFRIAEGEYENRRLFGMVGLFQNWASADVEGPNSEGALNFTVVDFFKALGSVDEETGDIKVLDPETLAGMELTLKVGQRKYADQLQNEVKGYAPKGAAKNTAKVASATSSLTSL